MSNLIARGPVNSLITPFTQDGAIDYPSLKRYLDLLITNQCATIYSMPFNGKYETLSDDEILTLNSVIATYIKSKAPSTTVICGEPIYCSAQTSIKFAKHYQSLGVDILSVYFGERYYSDQQMLDFFNLLTDNTNINLLIHEMKLPNGAGGNDILWPLPVIDALSINNKIVGIKEDCKNDDYLVSLGQYTQTLHFVISGGGMRRWRKMQRKADYASWLNGIGVVFPELENRYFKLYTEGNMEMCSNIEQIEDHFFSLLDNVYWHQLTKCGLEWRGLMSRHERLPMAECSDDQYDFVARELDTIKVDIESIGVQLSIP